ncbi:sensor histidine kinase [Vreelandella massiliensis]|uniref:sensor histidine kinase n=1 Tax=Vreelandella massiliensis TaxID=1816686 RepID=UPI00096A9585|nr:HAMP domain-containing sensor histidine kinase [Halomonas massiliensis]
MLMTLMAGMAHESNNLLSTIIGLSELNQALLTPPHPVLDNCQQIYQAGTRFANLIDDMTQSVGYFSVTLEPTDPARLAQLVLDMKRPHWPEGIVPKLDIEQAPIKALLDPVFVQRALVHMIDNALYAMANVLQPELIVRVTKGFNKKGLSCVLLSVQDNGSGIDANSLPHVFDAFFTTKPPGSGRGIGMTAIDVCAFQHGGDVLLSSEPGHGTYIALRLPLVSSSVNLANEVALPIVAPDYFSTADTSR